MSAYSRKLKIKLRHASDMASDPAHKFIAMEPGDEWMTATHALVVVPGVEGEREFKVMHPVECSDLPFDCPLARIEREGYTDDIPEGSGVYLVRWFCEMHGVRWPTCAEYEGEEGLIHIDYIEGVGEAQAPSLRHAVALHLAEQTESFDNAVMRIEDALIAMKHAAEGDK